MRDSSDRTGPARGLSRIEAAAAGVAAAAIALGLSQLLSGVLPEIPSMVLDVGRLVIDVSPAVAEDFAIRVFGINDKLALVVGIVAISLVVGALLGVASRRSPSIGAIGFALFGVLGAYAALRDPRTPPTLAVLAALATSGAGITALMWIMRPANGETEDGAEQNRRPGWFPRRVFLARGGGLAALALAFVGAGRLLAERGRAAFAGRDEVVLPPARDPAPAPIVAQPIDVPTLDPLITPNDVFYRIDTSLITPRVDPESWRLRVTGMVDRPYEMTFDDLLELPMVERYVTLSCVSNEVGGDLVGNAKWLGVPLRNVLNRAGVDSAATQVVGRSVDGFTVGFPTSVALDGRSALVAIGMNDEPLPFDHGFPARLVVSGLYGYVSATKWLSEIQLTTLEDFDAYWIPRGWAKRAPVKTQSRIDVPRHFARLESGPQQIAGFAWAPTRGIDKVEVQIGDGPWSIARLGTALTKDAWRRWVFDWDATPGDHTMRVRATDGDGQTQTSDESPPRPDGATGYHSITAGVR